MKLSRRFLRGLVAVASGAALGRMLLRSLSARGYDGPPSDHFDGHRFHNQEPTADKSILDLLRWQFSAPPSSWAWREVSPHTLPPERVGEGELHVTFINHSTTLLQLDGLNILTDPIWSDRTSPFSWAGPRRYHPPGVAFENLPPIDVVLISHNHFDHLDIPTLRRLSDAHRPAVFAGLGNREFLERHHIVGAVDLDWWESRTLSPRVELTALPVRHWSTRTRLDLRRTLWLGFALSSPAGRVYFPGDTGFGMHLDSVAAKFAPFRLSLLPIGSHLPRWFMRENHMSPEEAVEAHRILGSMTSVAIHHGTFDLGDDGQDEARERLAELTAASDDLTGFWLLDPGEGRYVPAVPDHERAFDRSEECSR